MPAVALVAQGLWAALLVLPVTVTPIGETGAVKYGNLYNELLEFIIPVDVTFYALMVGAVIALRLQGASSCTGPTGRSATRCPSWSTSASRSCWCSTSSTSSPGPPGRAT